MKKLRNFFLKLEKIILKSVNSWENLKIFVKTWKIFGEFGKILENTDDTCITIEISWKIWKNLEKVGKFLE